MAVAARAEPARVLVCRASLGASAGDDRLIPVTVMPAGLADGLREADLT